MRRSVVLTLATAAAVLAGVLVAAPAAQAHGYISSPPSRQAFCAQRAVPDCGDIQYEPQSVEGPKGLRSCHANIARFAVLSDDSRNWPATSVGSTVTFTWVLTAAHATSTWEYYIGDTRLAVFDDGGRRPPATVSHTVNLGGFTGRQKLLAVWNIADTANAFYACVDLQIGGGGNPNPVPTAPQTTAPPPPPTTPPVTTPPATTPPVPTAPAGATSWQPGVTYQVGSEVTYDGVRYRCRQAHTALTGWEPPNTPALWERLPLPAPAAAPPGAKSDAASAEDTWFPGVTYQVGSEVTYRGVRYRCRQAHTTLTGWEPPNTPALWERV